MLLDVPLELPDDAVAERVGEAHLRVKLAIEFSTLAPAPGQPAEETDAVSSTPGQNRSMKPEQLSSLATCAS